MCPKALRQSLLASATSRICKDREFLESRGLSRTQVAVDWNTFQEYRDFCLRRTLANAYANSRFYSRRFAEAGLELADIGGIEDLGRIPFTTSEDLSSNPYDFLCISQGKAIRAITFMSSGTTGPRKRVFFSRRDIERIVDYMAMGMATVTDASDIVQIMLPGGPPSGQCDLLSRGVARLGATPIVVDMAAPSVQQMESIIRNQVSIIFSETHSLYSMTKMMERDYDLASLPVHTLFLSTSYCSPAMREYLERVWDARVATHYGMTEMGLALAVSCPFCGAYHYDELDVIAEIIDPETGAILPEGSVGELVFTSLDRQAMPIIRYRSGDIARLGGASSLCSSRSDRSSGSHLQTIGDVRYRRESIVRLSCGVEIFPSVFDDAMFALSEVVDYDVILCRDELEREVLLLDVETLSSGADTERGIVRAVSESAVFAGVQQIPTIQVHLNSPGTLEHGDNFKKVIADLR